MSMHESAGAPGAYALSPRKSKNGEGNVDGGEPPLRDVFDTAAAADYLGVSVATLELLRVRGGGPKYVKLKRLVRYRHAALDEWMLARERRSTSDIDGGAE